MRGSVRRSVHGVCPFGGDRCREACPMELVDVETERIERELIGVLGDAQKDVERPAPGGGARRVAVVVPGGLGPVDLPGFLGDLDDDVDLQADANLRLRAGRRGCGRGRRR